MANYIVNAYNNGGSGGSVNMRSGPATTYGIVVRVPHGATVTGTKSGEWSYMTYGSNKGYMMSVFLDDAGTSTPSGSWVTRWTNTPGETVNVRSGAGTNYGIVTRLSHGTKVEVNNPTATWSQIRLYGSTSILGYIMTQYLVQSAPSTSTPSGSWVTRWTNTPGETVNVRSGAGKSYDIVRRLSHGTKVEVNTPTATWSQIRLYGSTSVLGYIMTEFLSSTDPNGSSGGSEITSQYTVGHFGSTNTGAVYVRKEPNLSSDNYGKIVKGSTFLIEGTTTGTSIDDNNIWVKVRYGTSTGGFKNAYIHSSFFTDIGAAPSSAEARCLQIANSLAGNSEANLGLGGDSCQQFIYWLCGASGKAVSNMPYDEGECGPARKYFNGRGEYQEWSESWGVSNRPYPGDLVYYGDRGADTSSHVGLVVQVNTSAKTYDSIECNLSDMVKKCTGSYATGKCTTNNKTIQGFAAPSWQ